MFMIRLATSADLPRLPDVEISAGKAFLATEHAWVAGDEPTAPESYIPRQAADNVWVAEMDGALAGFALTDVLDGAQHVYELAVRLDRQKLGIGRALMDAVIAAARERGRRAVTLTTFRGVVFNGPFYESLGFAILEAPPPPLADILAKEAEAGLTDRCAMRLAF